MESNKKDEVCRRLSHPKRFDFFCDLCKRFPYHDLNSALGSWEVGEIGNWPFFQ